MLGASRVIACVLTTALVAGVALAQPRKPPTDKEKAEAGELVKQAITRSQAGDHEGAVALYLKAYNIVPAPLLLSNVGNEHQVANKPIEALRYFCMYLKEDPTGQNATYATSQAKVLQIQLKNPVDDDRKVCDPPIAKGPVVPTITGPTPPTTTGPTAPVDPGVTGTPVGPSDAGRGMKVTGLIVTGLGVASVGIGLYFGVRAQTIGDDISSHTDKTIPWRNDIVAYDAEGQRAEDRQVAFLIGGGALVATGAILYFIGRSRAEQLPVAPMASANGGGIVFSTGF